MSLVTTSNLAKMNEDRFQKKKIKPAVYPPPQTADGFKNPSLENSFLQKNRENTVFQHPSIKNNYGYHLGPNGINIAVRNLFFKNPKHGNSFLQKDERTIFFHPSINNNYGYGVGLNGQPVASRDAFFTNVNSIGTGFGNSFIRNHEPTIFSHPTIKNDYGFGTPPNTQNDYTLPVLEHTLTGVQAGQVISFKQYIKDGEVIKDSKLQPYELDTQIGNPNYKGPQSLKTAGENTARLDNVRIWKDKFHIHDIDMNWDGLGNVNIINKSKQAKWIDDNIYNKYTNEDIQNFSGVRAAGWLSEPHIYRRPNHYLEEPGDNAASHKANFLGIGVGEIIDDVVRYAKHMVSPRGLIFLGKQFIMQSMNARRETGIFNPIGLLVSRNGFIRASRIMNFNVSALGDEDTGGFKKAGKGAFEFLKSLNPWNKDGISTYTDSLKSYYEDRTVEYERISARTKKMKKYRVLKKGGFGPLQKNALIEEGNEIKLTTPVAPESIFDAMAGAVADTVSGWFGGGGDSGIPSVPFSTKAVYTDFIPGGSGRVSDIPHEVGPQNETDSLPKYKVMSYKEIMDARSPINKNDKNKGPYSARVKGGPDRTLMISYGLDKGDWINSLDTQDGLLSETDIYSQKKDLIPFYIQILNTDETLVFRATITDLSEDITPNWESIEYIGRPDMQYVYKNTERKITFSFSIIPSNENEFDVSWRKINKLFSLNYPSLENMTNDAGIGGQRMVAPFVKLTIGDYIKEQAGYFEQITPKPIDNTGWILKDGKRLPMYMEVECSFVYIGNSMPQLMHDSRMNMGQGQFFDGDMIGSQVEDAKQDLEADDTQNLA